MELTKDVIFGVLSEADINSEAARFDYSGRGMDGKSCFAITCTDAEFRRFLIALSHDCSDSYVLAMQLSEAYSDSMGREKSIFYWPTIQIAG